MANVEEHVVSMKFNNKDFEKNAQQSLGTLDKLKKALHFKDSGESLKKLGEEADKLDFTKATQSLAALEKRFSTLGIVGMTAVQNITNSAVDLGKSIVKDVMKPMTNAINQIKSGGLSRAFNLEHAHFQLMGLVNDEQKVADILNGPVAQAVDGTAYGLDQAAVAASSLVASGLQTEQLLGPLKAIAGVASMTGRDYSDIADIFTTVASNGKLMTMQLRQLSASGLNASAALAKSMNKTEAEINEMVTQGKISFAQFSDAMSEAFGENAARANETFSGALSNVKAALSRIGAKVATPGLEQIRDLFNEIRPRINDFNTLVDAGIQHINNIVARFSQLGQKILKSSAFMDIMTRAANAFNMSMERLDKLLSTNGPIIYGFQALGNIIKAIQSFIEPVIKAFLDIFPPQSIYRIAEMVKHFRDFTASLMASEEVAQNIQRTFRGVFSVIRGVGSIIKMVAGFVFDFVKGLAPAGTMLTDVFGTVGDILTDVGYYIQVIKTAIEYTVNYFNIFGNIGSVIGKVFSSVGGLVSNVIKLVGGGVSWIINSILSIFGVVLSPIRSAGDLIAVILEGVGYAISFILGLVDKLAGFIGNIAEVFGQGASAVKDFGISIDSTGGIIKVFSVALNVLKTIISAVIVAIGSLFDGVEGAGGIFSTLKDFFVGFANAISNAWRTYSTFIKSTFFSGASTIGSTLSMLAGKLKEFASGLTLSRIAAAAFIATMIAIAVAITRILFTVDKVIDSFTGAGKSVQNFFDALSSRISPTVTPVQKLTAVLKQLAIVIVVVTGALVILANTPNVDEAVKNLGLIAAGIAVLTLLVTGLAKLAQKARLTRQIAAVSASMLAISASILVLSLALRTMNGVDTTDILAKSAAISLMTVALGGSAALMSKIAPNLSKGMLGLLFFAFSVKKVTEALSIITNSDLDKIKDGLPTLLAIFAGLSVLAVALGNVRLTSGLGFLLVALAIKMMIPVISDAINAAAKIDFQPLMDFIEEYRYSLLAIGGVAIAAVLVGRALSSSVKAFAVGLLALTGAVALLFNIVERVGNMDMGVLKRGGAAVGQILIIFGLLMVASALTRKAKPMQMGASFFLMAGAIAALTGCIFLLGKMDSAVLKQGGIAVGAILGIFGVLMALSALTAKAQPMKIGAMFVAMAGAIAALTGCMYIIGLMEPDKLQKGTIAVGIMLGAFALIVGLSALTKKAQPSKMAVMFLAMAGAILAISHCIETLGSLSLEQILKGSVPIAALMLLLTGVATKLSNLDIKSMKSTIVLVGGVIAMIATVVAAVMILGEQPVGNVIQGGVVIFAMLKVIEKFGERIVKIANGMNNWMSAIVLLGGIIGALWTIVGSLAALSSIDTGKLIISGTVLLGVVFVIQKIMQEIDKSKINPATLAGFYEATRIVAIIALAIAGVAVFCSWPEILSAGATISGVLALFGQLMIKMSKDGTRIKTKQLQNFLKASGILIIIAGSITALAMSANWPEILSAGSMIAGVMAVFAGVFKYVSKIEVKPKDMAGFLTAALVIGEIALFASFLADAGDWKQIAAACVGIAAVVAALGKVLGHFNDEGWKIEKSSLGKIPAIIAKLIIISVLMGQVVASISALANSGASWDQIVASAAGISGTLIALSGACTILGNVDGAAAVKGALVAAKILGIFIGAAGIVVMVASILDSIEGFRDAIIGGGNLLYEFAKAIGKFFGGIIEGFGLAILNLVEAAGKTLAQFAKDIVPFVDEMKKIDDSVMSGVGALVEVILALGAAKVLSAWSNFITLGFGNTSLKEDLLAFADTIAAFNEKTKGITDANRFKTIAEATKELASVIEVINENKDSLFEKLFDKAFGLNDFTDQANALGGFIESVGKLAGYCSEASNEDLSKLSIISTAVKNLTDAMPDEPSVWDKLFGDGYKLPDKFGEQLKSFATSLVGVSNMIADVSTQTDPNKIDVAKIQKLSEIAQPITDLVAAMPSYMSTWYRAFGDFDENAKEDMDIVGERLVSFVSALQRASDLIPGVNDDNVDKILRYANDTADVINKLPIVSNDTSDNLVSLTEAGEYVAQFAQKLIDANDVLGGEGVDLTNLYSVTPAIQAFGDILMGLGNINVKNNDITGISNIFTNFATAMGDMNELTKDFDAEKYETFAAALKKVIKVFNFKFSNNQDYKGITKLCSSLMELNKTVKDLTLYTKDDMDSFADSANDFKDKYLAFAEGVGNGTIVGQINTFIANFNHLKEAFMGVDTSTDAGKAAFESFKQFAKGIERISTALQTFAAGDTNISVLSSYLDTFKTTMSDFITYMNSVEYADIERMEAKLTRISEAFAAFEEAGGKSKSKKSAKSLKNITGNLNTAVNNIKNIMTNLNSDIKDIADGMPDYAKQIMQGLTDAFNSEESKRQLRAAGVSVSTELVKAMNPDGNADVSSGISTTCANLIMGFKNGFRTNESSGGFWQVGVDAAQKFISGFTSKKGMDEASPSKRMKKSGDYAVQGFINGIIADEDKLKKSGTNMGSTFLDALDNDLGIHSPAAALFERAKQVVAGWLGGLKDGAGKIFESGNSFGGDFLGGLKNAIEKIKKGDFNGESILENLKKKLGVNKLIDAKKDASKIGKDLGKALENAGNSADAKTGAEKGGSAAGAKMGNETVKAYKETVANGLSSIGNILGDHVKAKDLAKALDVTKDKAKGILKTYTDSIKAISKNSRFLEASLTNPAAIYKFSKAYLKETKYIANLAKRLNKYVEDSSKKISKAAISTVGKLLAQNTKEYKDAEKSYKKYTDKIAKNQQAVKRRTEKFLTLQSKFEKATTEKDKKKWLKQIQQVQASLSKLEQKTVEARKKAAAEMAKMANASRKSLKQLRSEIKETVKSWFDFQNIDGTSSLVRNGFEELEKETNYLSNAVDVLNDNLADNSDALDNTTDAANNATKAYDALSASMDTGINLFERFNKTGTVESTALFENADSQLEAFEEFQNGIEELERRGLDVDLVDQLAAEGPEALNKIRGFLSMSSDELQKYNERIDKQHEYEERALERSLRRQYEQYQEWVSKVEQLKIKLGTDNINIVESFAKAGTGSLNTLSRFLGMDGESLDNAKKYFAESLKNIQTFGFESLSNSTPTSSETGKTPSIFDNITSLLQGMVNNNLTNEEMRTAYQAAINRGLDPELALQLYQQNNKKLLNEIASADSSMIESLNKEWAKASDLLELPIEQKMLSMDDIYESYKKQVEGQDADIAAVDKLKSLRQMLINTASSSDMSADAISKSYDILVADLKEAGKSEAEIYNILQKAIDGSNGNIQKIRDTLKEINERESNNTEITGKQIAEDWDNVSKTAEDKYNALKTVVDKMGPNMNKALFDTLREMDPEKIIAMSKMNESQLQAMADQFINADKLSKDMTDDLEYSVITALSNTANSETVTQAYSFIGKTHTDSLKKATVASPELIADMSKNAGSGLVAMAEAIGSDEAVLTPYKKAGKTLGKAAANGVGEGLAANIDKATPALKKAGKKLVEAAESSGEGNGDSVGDIYSKAGRQLGENIINGFGNKVKSKESVNGSKAALNELSNKVVTNSKTKYYSNAKNLGLEIVRGIIAGFNSKVNDIKVTVENGARNLFTLTRSIYYQQGYWLGQEIVSGLASGIYDSSNIIKNAVEYLARETIAAARSQRNFDINSPSKKFIIIGNSLTEGLAKGIANNTMAETAIGKVAHSTIEAMRDAITKANTEIDGSLQLSPIITPKLDLSLVKNRAGSINRLFDARVEANAELVAANQNGEPNTTGNTTFIQNNYSPKALSREEIYRQTKNQFAMARKAVKTNDAIYYSY